MARTFENKVVIVTGGNNGIGAATVASFLDQGAKVASLDIRKPSREANANVLDIECDISVENNVNIAVKQVLEKWGTIDVLANVAGVMDNLASVADASNEMWTKCFAVNVNGPFYLTKAVVKHFLTKEAEQKGSIVNVCSTASVRGSAAGTAYTASKHALLGLSRSTAWQYAREGIRCNAVIPGGVKTNIMGNSEVTPDPAGYQRSASFMQAMPGLCEPQDIANTIVFLANAQSVNGAEVAVDHGWTTA